MKDLANLTSGSAETTVLHAQALSTTHLGSEPVPTAKAASKCRHLAYTCAAGVMAVLVTTVLTVAVWAGSANEVEAQGASSGPAVAVARTAASVAEDAPADALPSFIIVLSETPTTNVAVSFNVDTSVYGAASAGDYSLSPTGSVTFAANTTVLEQRVKLTPVNDNLEEWNETVTLRVSGCMGCTPVAVPSATITITDDDLPELTVRRVGSPEVIEGSVKRFIVKLSKPSAYTIHARYILGRLSTVHYRNRNLDFGDGNDYSSDFTLRTPGDEALYIEGTLIFMPGQTQKEIDLHATLDADTNEDTESVALDFFSEGRFNCRCSMTSSGARAVTWIRDPNNTDVEVGVYRKGVRDVNEGETSSFSVYLLGRTTTAEVSVPYIVNLDPSYVPRSFRSYDATTLDDFTLSESSPLVFEAGTDQKDISFTPTYGSLGESTELVGFEVASGPGYTAIPNSRGFIRIFDQPKSMVELVVDPSSAPTVSICCGTQSASEGQPVSFTVALQGSFEGSVSVPYSVQLADSDNLVSPLDFLMLPSRSVTFTEGEFEKIIFVKTIDDSLDEPDEVVKVVLRDDAGYAVRSGDGSAAMMIVDNDDPPVASIVELSSPSVTEGSGGTFKIKLTGDFDRTVPVRFDLAAASTVSSSDISFSPDRVVTLTPDTSETTVHFTIVDDDTGDLAKTVVIELLDDSEADARYTADTGIDSATVNIAADGETPIASISLKGSTHVYEGKYRVVEVALSGPAVHPLRVEFEVDADSTNASVLDFVLQEYVPSLHDNDPSFLAADSALLAGQWVEFMPGDPLIKRFIMRAVDDTIDETYWEALTFRLVSGDNYVVNPYDSKSPRIFIGDNDSQPTASISGGGPVFVRNYVPFTIALSKPSGRTVSVGYSTTSSGVSSSDYRFSVGIRTVHRSVEFAPGEMVKTLDLTLTSASSSSSPASVTVTLNRNYGLHGLGSSRSATAWVRNSASGAAPVASISTVSAVAVEGSGGGDASFKVKLSEEPVQGSPVSVGYAVSTGAGAGEYSLAGTAGRTSGSVVFRAGERLEQTVALSAVDDNSAESPERVEVVLTSAATYAVKPGEGSAVAWLRDASSSQVALISRNGLEHVAEGQSGSFEVMLVGPARTEPVTVKYAVASDMAENSDYVLSPAGSVVIPANETSATVVLKALDDLVFEPDERVTVTLVAEQGAGYTVSSADGSASLVIVDTDAVPVASLVRLGAADMPEGQSRDFAVVLDTVSQNSMRVDYQLSSVSAAQASDVAWSSPGAVWFAPGESYRIVTMTAVADREIENDEVAEVELVAGRGYDGSRYSISSTADSASVTIVDVSVPVASISRVGALAAAEGDDRMFQVSLRPVPSRPVTVGFEVDTVLTGAEVDPGDGSGDFALPLPASVSFAAGEAGPKTFTVIMNDDRLYEAAERVTIKLTDGSGYEVTPMMADSRVSVELTDNDSAPVASITSSGSIAENANTTGSFTISLAGASEFPVRVFYGVDSVSSADGPADYSLSGPGYVTFAPGGATFQTVSLTPVADSVDEANESVVVYLFGGPHHTVDAVGDDATIEIIDANDPPEAFIELLEDGDSDGSVDDVVSSGVLSVSEGGTATFRVSLSVASAREVSVPYRLAAPGLLVSPASADDFSPVGVLSGTAVIPAGSTTSEPVMATVKNDNTTEEPEAYETAVVELVAPDSSVVNPAWSVSDSQGLVAVKIVENEGWKPTVSIARDGARSMDEDQNRNFKISLDGASSQTVVVRYMLDDPHSSAEEVDDFTLPALSSATTPPSLAVTFMPDDTSEVVPVTVIDDAFFEDNETVTLKLVGSDDDSDASNDLYTIDTSAQSADVLIADNDTKPEASVEIVGMSEVEEGGDLQFRIRLSSESGRVTRVKYTVVPGSSEVTSGDYTPFGAQERTARIPAEQETTTVTLTTTDDREFEDDETVTLQLSPVDADDPYTLKSMASSQTITITDNDTPPVASITGPAALTEGVGSGNFTITLTPAPQSDTIVRYTIAATSSIGSYTLVPAPTSSTTGQVTVASSTAASASTTITLTPAAADGDSAPDQQLTLTLLDDSAYDLDPVVANRSATAVIYDDIAEATVSFGFAGASSVYEGGYLNFKVSLSRPAGRALDFTYTVGSSSPNEAELGTAADYTLNPPTRYLNFGFVQIAQGSQEALIRLDARVNDDGPTDNNDSSTADETVTLTLSLTQHIDLYPFSQTPAIATATIKNGPAPSNQP